jgi:hypothetical protein
MDEVGEYGSRDLPFAPSRSLTDEGLLCISSFVLCCSLCFLGLFVFFLLLLSHSFDVSLDSPSLELLNERIHVFFAYFWRFGDFFWCGSWSCSGSTLAWWEWQAAEVFIAVWKPDGRGLLQFSWILW